MMMIRRTLSLFTLLLAVLTLGAQTTKEKPVLEVRVVEEKKDLHKGDSMLVIYRLLSNVPFAKVKPIDKPKAKHGSLREVGNYLRQGRLEENGTMYYTVDVSRYVLSPDHVGQVELLPATFEAELIVGEREQDPFDTFFYGPQYVTEKKTVKSNKKNIRVSEAPLRKTQEILQSGRRMM